MSVIPNDPLDNKNFILYDMNVIFNGPLEKKIVSYIIWITIIFNDPLDSRVPSLWDPLLDELRWSLCNNNRNQVPKDRNVLESFWNPPPPTPPPVCGNSLPRNWSLVPKRLGTAALDDKNPILHNMINAIFDGHLDYTHIVLSKRDIVLQRGPRCLPCKVYFITATVLFCT